MSYYDNPYFEKFDDFDTDCECCCRKQKCCPVKPKYFRRRCPKIDVLQAVSLTPQTVAPGLPVPFDTNLVSTGNAILHTAGSTDFNLLAAGVYKVTFTGTVSPVETTIAGVALAINGTIVPGTTVTETVPAAGDLAGLATQAIIQVSPCINTVLTVVNPTADTQIYTNPNIIIEKIG